MPYLDMDNRDDRLDLSELFFAAHPLYGAVNALLCTEAHDPGAFFATPALLGEIAAWGQQRGLISREGAVQFVANVNKDCEDYDVAHSEEPA